MTQKEYKKRVKYIESKILDYAKNNKLDELTRIMLAHGKRKYCLGSESWIIGYGKGGLCHDDDDDSYYAIDELDLSFHNENEHKHTEYKIQGKTMEEQAMEVAIIIARNTKDWIETEEYWASPEEVLPF